MASLLNGSLGFLGSILPMALDNSLVDWKVLILRNVSKSCKFFEDFLLFYDDVSLEGNRGLERNKQLVQVES